MRKSFITRVAGACALFSAFTGAAGPADAAVVFAGTCVTTAQLSGTRLTLTANTCVYAPQVSASLVAWGDLAPVAPVGACGMGVYQSDVYSVDTTADATGRLHVVNTGTLQVSFVSGTKMLFLGELAPLSNPTCPSSWTGVLVIEDPELSEQ